MVGVGTASWWLELNGGGGRGWKKKTDLKDKQGNLPDGGRRHCFVVVRESGEKKIWGERVKRENKNETRWASFVSFFFVFFFFF